MPAVTINKGRYYVGNPLTLFPDWTPSPSCTYREGAFTFHAFKFGNSYVAVVPVGAISDELLKPKDKADALKPIVTFDGPTVFFEQNGAGAVGTISL